MNNRYLETIKSQDGIVFNLEYHQKRYETVLNSLGVDKVKNLQDYIKPPQFALYRCRVEYNFDSINVTYHKYKKRDISSLKLIFDNDIEYSEKKSNREDINRLYERREECDDILIIKNLLVTDTSIANIAFYDSGVWITPKSPLLKGTTRARLLDKGLIVEKDIGVHEIRKFSKVALLNAMIGFDVLDSYEILI